MFSERRTQIGATYKLLADIADLPGDTYQFQRYFGQLDCFVRL